MQSSIISNPFETRLRRLRDVMAHHRLPFLLVTKPVNIFYLSGFQGSAGAAIFGASEAILWVDPRYTLQARGEARGVEVIEEKRQLLKAVARWLRRKKIRRLFYEDLSFTCAQLRQLAREAPPAMRFEPVGTLIEELRAVKDSGEVERIRDAGRLTSAVFEEVLPQVRPGVSESALAAELEYRMKRHGAERVAFETIVASGLRGALPHARASSKRLQKSELVVFDLGAILGGYAADMTRTLYLGRPSQRVRWLYSAVMDAQERALEAVQVGIRAEEVDQTARRVLARRGLDKYFTHSTGHGVGLEIHERPRLAQGEKMRLGPGSVVTVEPGIYLEGFGGIRIEDTVLVSDHGSEILTPAPKTHWFIT